MGIFETFQASVAGSFCTLPPWLLITVGDGDVADVFYDSNKV